MIDRSQIDARLLDAVAAIAVSAGKIIARHHTSWANVEQKPDGSPVTAADREANEFVVEQLQALLPHLPIVSEENADSHALPDGARQFLLVDPLDGTKEFVDGSSDFTVNIGWIRDGAPVAGVVYAPALRRLWIGGASAEVLDLPPSLAIGHATRQAIAVRPAVDGSVTVLASRRHCNLATEAYLTRLPRFERMSAGSSIKFCMIAEGRADFYPRLSPTMQWDTAAGDAVLRAAGGVVTTLAGAELTYGLRDDGFANPDFLAVGDVRFLPQAVDAGRQL